MGSTAGEQAHGTRGARMVSAAGYGDSIRKATIGFMLYVCPPGEGLSSGLGIPHSQ